MLTLDELPFVELLNEEKHKDEDKTCINKIKIEKGEKVEFVFESVKDTHL